MSDDSADKMAEMAVMAVVYLLFGVFILAFKYPKVMIPLLVVAGVVIAVMASQ